MKKNKQINIKVSSEMALEIVKHLELKAKSLMQKAIDASNRGFQDEADAFEEASMDIERTLYDIDLQFLKSKK